MSIFVIGINHKTAPIAVREKVYFARDMLPLYLQDLLNGGHAGEAVLLSTCNRSELYCDTDDITSVRDWFAEQTTLSRQELESALYVYRQEDAVIHMTQVACGLDSMVLGEPQILGQLKDAFSESCSAGAVGALFHRLFQQIFSLAKEIRTTTAIGACPVSVVSAAVHFAKQLNENFANANVVLIGAGETTELFMRYLTSHLANPVTVVNRNIEKAAALTQQYGGQVYGLEDLAEALQDAHYIFSATGSAHPLVTQQMMIDVMRVRKHQPLTFIDIAVPRDIDPAIAELPNVQLFCIDDLKAIIEKNRQGREHAADKARELIRIKSQDFIASLHSIDKIAHAISAYRGQIEDLSRGELLKARQQLREGKDPIEVLDSFVYGFTQKLLHAPSVQLRQAGAEGKFELLRFAKQLFSIPETETL